MLKGAYIVLLMKALISGENPLQVEFWSQKDILEFIPAGGSLVIADELICLMASYAAVQSLWLQYWLFMIEFRDWHHSSIWVKRLLKDSTE